MHRKIVSTVLVIHLLLMMLVVSFNSQFDFTNRGMIVVGILGLYVVLLLIYLRTKALYALVVLGIVLYFVLNATVFVFLASGSFTSLKDGGMLFLSFVFLPGLYCSFAYFMFLVRDRKYRTGAA